MTSSKDSPPRPGDRTAWKESLSIFLNIAIRTLSATSISRVPRAYSKETPAMAVNAPLNRKLRMGLVGGGQGAFIGRVHSIAAVLDNRASLVAGALSSDPAKARASAPDYDIPPERAYGSYQEMVEAESKLPKEERIDFASVETPNHTHF